MLFQLTTSRRGRRWCRLPLLFLRDISTHDLTKRSTGITEEKLQKDRYFNSRPHEEVDSKLSRAQALEVVISTHDLTKRSTDFLVFSSCLIVFQLTTSRRGRRRERFCLRSCLYFNSRPHEEVDMVAATLPIWKNHFNSRPHEEVDWVWGYSRGGTGISTHDLTKRSTPIRHPVPKRVVFQLTTSRRGRQQFLLKDMISNPVFQLTTSRRGRQQFLRKKFSFQNHFLCSLHIIYSYYINTIFFSTLFLAKSSFFLVRIP